jgi:hypothetical protein
MQRIAMPSSANQPSVGRMIDLLQIDHRGEGVELLEHVVCARVVDAMRDRPALVGHVAERDRA